MLTFRTRRSFSGKGNYLGHDFQRKGLWIVMLVGGAMFLFSAGGVSKFGKLFGPRGSQTAAEPAGDNRVVPPVIGDKNTPDAVQAVLGKRPQPVEGKKLFGGMKPELFTVLEDDAVYRRDENESFFTLLKCLADADPRDIELASTGLRTFRQLQDQSDDYRGEIVTVKGTVSRILPQMNPPENSQGVEKFYEVWIEPVGNRLPIVAVCLELPADYPTGGAAVDVGVTGFFYKRLGYASAEMGPPDPLDGTRHNIFRSSPLVLARTLSWQLKPSLNPIPDEAVEAGPPLPFGISPKYVYHVLGGGFLLMIMLSVWSLRMMRTSVLRHGPIVGRARRAAEQTPDPTDLNSLKIEP